MVLSKTTSYALRVLIHMAENEDYMVNAVSLHRDLDIKQQYLRRLLTELTKKKFIISIRGRAGGYTLSRKAENIAITEIIEAFEGADLLDECILGVSNCRKQPVCHMHELWAAARKGILVAFEAKTLADMRSGASALLTE